MIQKLRWSLVTLSLYNTVCFARVKVHPYVRTGCLGTLMWCLTQIVYIAHVSVYSLCNRGFASAPYRVKSKQYHLKWASKRPCTKTIEEGWTKMVKKTILKNLKVSSRFKTVSFRVVVLDATTELQDSKQILSNTTTYLIKTFVTVLLAQPAFINSSATQCKWAVIFPQKAMTTVCLAVCINPSSMTWTKQKVKQTKPNLVA